jgi:hypothetical protein
MTTTIVASSKYFGLEPALAELCDIARVLHMPPHRCFFLHLRALQSAMTGCVVVMDGLEAGAANAYRPNTSLLRKQGSHASMRSVGCRAIPMLLRYRLRCLPLDRTNSKHMPVVNS